MIGGYPNFEWAHINPIIDGYKNEDDDQSEYKRSKGFKKKYPLKTR